ncbi:hypothetical protein [Methylobacter sp. YRD-M1]|uniref:hypothetical protein n=1 Tax=Methylobacter sp. YRD-M1 TaxID=2911520 RepID=UPI00227D381E|nr:hypothetical protein [Methylobacter sp. YRD-M1]WAK03156.1 hypothetical protein LZ558_05060 [Methylobacter sp. YRD-M1]
MRTFFAVQHDKVFYGGWQQCLRWARKQIQENHTAIQLLTARGGDKEAVVIAEITADYERIIYGGRKLSIKGLKDGQAKDI